MEAHLFAGVAVSDFGRAVTWYERLFGEPETFRAHETEYVWTLAEDRSVYVLRKPGSAGHGMVTVMLDGLEALDELVAAASRRGIEPETVETYDHGVRKVVYRDPDGNEVGFGGLPADAPE